MQVQQQALCARVQHAVGLASPKAAGKWLHGLCPVLCRSSCLLQQHDCFDWWERQPSTHQLPESRLQDSCKESEGQVEGGQ